MEEVLPDQDTTYNMYNDEELLALADGDPEYLSRLAAAKMARMRFEADPGNDTLRGLKARMDQELIAFELSTGRRKVPPDETS